MRKLLLASFLSVACLASLFGQTYRLFEAVPTPYDATFNTATYLQVDQQQLVELLTDTTQPVIYVPVPIQGVAKVLVLERKNYFAGGFKAMDSDGQIVPTSKPSQFAGYVAGYGEENSLAFLNVHDGEIVGTVVVLGETFLIGNEAEQHFVIAESILETPDVPMCSGEPLEIPESEKVPQKYETNETQCKYIGVYFEIGNLMVQAKGGAKGATDYLTGMFGVVAYLYEKEQINIKISEVKVWTTPEPYTYSSSSTALNAFRNNLKSNFNGNLAHLVNIAPGGLGGVAYVDVLCNKTFPAFSDINGTYSQFPTYSWDVMVVAHEMGHNIGSPHTQNCGWTLPNGAKGALDNCYAVEGNCAVHPDKPGLSTIMSYCHLTSAGISLQKGFGEQPGNLIRSRYAAAGCLGTGDCDDGGGDDGDDGGNGGGESNYCSVTGGNTAYEYIAGVTLNQSYTNESRSGYVDELEKIFTVSTGQNYTLSVTPGYPSQTKWPEKISVFADLNADGDFSDSGEMLAQGLANKEAFVQNISIPTSAKTGKTRLRVIMKFEGQNHEFAGACDSPNYGQAIDYTLQIGQGDGGNDCDAPVFSSYAANIADNKTTLSWNFSGTQRSFQLRYRQQGGEWTTTNVSTNSWIIPLLSFETQVKAACSDWSKTLKIKLE